MLWIFVFILIILIISFSHRKYYLSVLAIFKNESMNLREWLDHYIWQGVDHFYLINNGSTDDYQSILKEYDNISIINLESPNSQVEHYNTAFEFFNIKNYTEWLIVCDLDEFYYAIEFKNLKDYLKSQSNTCIISSMHMFGSRDEYEHPKSIRKAFLHRDSTLHTNGKSILRAAFINELSVHEHNMNGKCIRDDKNIHLNHYVIQSKEYFDKIKKTRGDVMSKGNFRDDDYFKKYDKREVFDDGIVKKMLNDNI